MFKAGDQIGPYTLKLWDHKTVEADDEFMKLGFEMYSGGFGTPAKFRSTTVEKEAFSSRVGKQWKPEWNEMFTQPADKKAVFKAYDSLVEAFINDITRTSSHNIECLRSARLKHHTLTEVSHEHLFTLDSASGDTRPQ